MGERAGRVSRPHCVSQCAKSGAAYGYNPLRRIRDENIPLAASGLLETLKKLWPDAWGVRMEHVLRNTLYALLERDDLTLPDILQMYRDERFRRTLATGICNETVQRFWRHEFENYPWRLRAEAVVPIFRTSWAPFSPIQRSVAF